ncbi:MAG: DUF4097 family beta strand repeat-containing protein [Steroidobacteraceae bacterium]
MRSIVRSSKAACGAFEPLTKSVIFASLVLLLLGVCAMAAAHADERIFDRKVAADPHGTVEISNVAGRIAVSGWDGAEVDVHGELGEGVDRVDVESDHGRTTIKVIVPNNSFRSVSTNLRVRVPRASELDISAVSADVTETDVQGALQLKTVSGDVKADIFQKGAELKTVSGDVVLRGRGEGSELHISTVSGNIRVDHGAGALEATTVSGDLNVHLDSTKDVRVRTTSGDMSFEGKLLRGGSIDAESVSGELTVRAIPESGYDYEVTTFSGDITNCMGVQSERVSKYGPGTRLVGTQGQSAEGARIRVKTMSGDVELCSKN